ncbi:MAG: FixH family protein [Acidobacteria bacterium]|nr:FixH family protein [Acidobacteriota bacterium]
MRTRGRAWPWALGALLAAAAAANGLLIYFATSDPSFAVEPDYYAKGLAWDRAQEQERVNRGLGWQLELDVREATALVTVRDRAGAALTGAQVEAEAFASARSGSRRALHFEEQPGAVYRAPLAGARPGLWEFRIRVRRGAETFTRTTIVELDRP